MEVITQAERGGGTFQKVEVIFTLSEDMAKELGGSWLPL